MGLLAGVGFLAVLLIFLLGKAAVLLGGRVRERTRKGRTTDQASNTDNADTMSKTKTIKEIRAHE